MPCLFSAIKHYCRTPVDCLLIISDSNSTTCRAICLKIMKICTQILSPEESSFVFQIVFWSIRNIFDVECFRIKFQIFIMLNIEGDSIAGLWTKLKKSISNPIFFSYIIKSIKIWNFDWTSFLRKRLLLTQFWQWEMMPMPVSTQLEDVIPTKSQLKKILF